MELIEHKQLTSERAASLELESCSDKDELISRLHEFIVDLAIT